MSGTARTVQNLWGSTVVRSTVVGLGVFGALLTTSLVIPVSAHADDSSAVTVTTAQLDPDAADAPFPDLSVTVSQTTNLTDQGIRLTYSGGQRSSRPNNQVAGDNFLQVFQCWGDLLDSAGQPILDADGQRQPDRSTCQYGAGVRNGFVGQSRSTVGVGPDILAPQDSGTGVYNPSQQVVSIPFRSVSGKTVALIQNGTYVPDVDPDNNEFFTPLTTNELDWAPFGASGSGTATFEVQTNMQSPGLGCGNPITATDGSVSGQPCWLVVVPRGYDKGENTVNRSALLWDNWKHRLAVPLQFKPLGVRCAIGAAEKSLAGTELMTTAVGSWQPTLCGAAGGSIYNLIVADESDQLVQSTGAATAPMTLTTRALDSPGTTGLDGADITDNLTYAPVAVTGLTIGFALDHVSNPLDPASVPDAVKGLDGLPITSLNLTPRLVAKLLTNSYRESIPGLGDPKRVGSNPVNLTKDPDFLAINDPMWTSQNIDSPAVADAFVSLGRSDAAVAVWNYVLSDADAVAFLAGKPDPWGMVVNPYSSTDAKKNPNGVAASFPTDSFPKADPFEYDYLKAPDGASVLNLVTWRPYASDLDTSAYWVLRGDGRVPGSWDNQVTPPKYAASTRDYPGNQKVIGVTDTAAAAKYQIFTAALRNPAGAFVTATTASMAAAAAVMTPTEAQPQVRALDYSAPVVKKASEAYPLTVPVYAATNPVGGDVATRAAYAAFIRYAASSAAQTPGTDLGQLPPGYAPLPDSWRTTSNAVAALLTAPPASPSPTATPTSAPTTTDEGASGTGDDGSAATSDQPAVPPAAVPDQPAPATVAPVATGEAAGALQGASTPDDSTRTPAASAVPASVVAGLTAAACVPLIRRRPLGP